MNELPPPHSGPPNRDDEQLNLLSIFHYVLAGLALVGMAFLLLHYLIFSSIINNPKMIEQMQKNQANQAMDPREFFDLFQWVYVFFGLCLILAAVGNFLSGWYIREKMNRTFSLVVAGLNCLQVPFGTALGVFTIIVLMRDSVRGLYEAPLQE